MKQSNRRELLLRVVASSAEATLFYVGYVLINHLTESRPVNILLFVFIALCGLFINLLPYNSSDKRKQSLMYSSVGLVLASLVTIASAITDFSLFSLPVVFAASISIYYRSNISYLSNVFYVYTIGDFNRGLGILFLINVLAAYFADTFGIISSELMRYAVLYIVMGLYMLTEIKNFRYVSRSENNKKSYFDILATSFMIIMTIIMSVPKIFEVVTKPFAIVFGFIYGLIAQLLVWASYPFSIVISVLHDLFYLEELGNVIEDKIGKNSPLAKLAEKGLVDKYDPNLINLLELLGKILTFVFMLAVCVFLLYVLFKFINRLNRSKVSEDFEEEKEFIRNKKNSKGPGLIKRLGDSVKRAAGEIAFMLTANNADRLRSEYKDFIKNLYIKKYIEHYNYTALDIYEIVSKRAPSQKTILENITHMYEEVRYGVKYPQDNELKAFRKELAEVSKAIL